MIALEIAGSRARIGSWAFPRIGAAVPAATLAVALALPLGERAPGIVRGGPTYGYHWGSLP